MIQALWTLLFIFSSFFVVACHKKVSSRATSSIDSHSQENAPKVENDGENDGHIDSDEQKKRRLQQTIRLLDQGGKIAAETWRLLAQHRSQPRPLMSTLAQRLQAHIQQQKFLPRTITGSRCSKDHQYLQMDEVKVQTKLEMSLYHVKCHADQILAQDLLAQMIWDARAEKMLLRIEPKYFPEILGESLALLNHLIDCRFQKSESDKLEHLSCKNLGQGTDRVGHVFYHTFEYDSQAQGNKNLLFVLADRYENLMARQFCDSQEPCLRLQVPGMGKISVLENRIKKQKVTTESQLIASLPLGPEKPLEEKSDLVLNPEDPPVDQATHAELKHKEPPQADAQENANVQENRETLPPQHGRPQIKRQQQVAQTEPAEQAESAGASELEPQHSPETELSDQQTVPLVM